MTSVNVMGQCTDLQKKLRLPSLFWHPGKLHFLTGLKFDLFGIGCGSFGTVYIYELPEGHWPGGKTAYEVLYMIQHNIGLHLTRSVPCKGNVKVDLSCENCGGQNKSRFVIWFTRFTAIVAKLDSVTLRFMVPGNTNNHFQGKSDIVKRRLSKSYEICPRDMYRVIEESGANNRVVVSSDVQCLEWKSILANCFKIPPSLRINSYYVFQARKSTPRVDLREETEYW